jgi:hypothetical protein
MLKTQCILSFDKADGEANFSSLSDNQKTNLAALLTNDYSLQSPLFLFFVSDVNIKTPDCLLAGQCSLVVNVAGQNFAKELDAIKNDNTCDCIVVCKDNSGKIMAVNNNGKTVPFSQDQDETYGHFLSNKKINNTIQVAVSELDTELNTKLNDNITIQLH